MPTPGARETSTTGQRGTGYVEHSVPECENECDIFNVDILLDFLKTILKDNRGV